MFDPLSQYQLLGVARLLASELNSRLAPKNITLEMTDAALTYAVAQAYDPAYGARPLRRWLEHTVITDLSRMIVGGELPENSTVTCDYPPAGDKLAYAVVAKPLPQGVAAGLNGTGAWGALKRQLEPMGSDALGSIDDMEQ
jgi:ATP-dependent Clp protease ATP-binding subunit ClpB